MVDPVGIAVDFAESPGLEVLKANDVIAVGRYLTGQYAISAEELASYLFDGIAVWFAFEIAADDIAGGYAGGVENARAVDAALSELGIPLDQPVYFAVDEDVTLPSQVLPYFQGISSVRPPSTNGDYSEGAVIEFLHDSGLTAWHWQSESTGFLGNAAQSPFANLRQVYNASPIPNTDRDEMLTADFGQYPRPVIIEPPAPAKKEYEIMDAVVMPNGDIVSHAVTTEGHYLEITRKAGTQGQSTESDFSVIDVSDLLAQNGQPWPLVAP